MGTGRGEVPRLGGKRRGRRHRFGTQGCCETQTAQPCMRPRAPHSRLCAHAALHGPHALSCRAPLLACMPTRVSACARDAGTRRSRRISGEPRFTMSGGGMDAGASRFGSSHSADYRGTAVLGKSASVSGNAQNRADRGVYQSFAPLETFVDAVTESLAAIHQRRGNSTSGGGTASSRPSSSAGRPATELPQANSIARHAHDVLASAAMSTSLGDGGHGHVGASACRAARLQSLVECLACLPLLSACAQTCRLKAELMVASRNPVPAESPRFQELVDELLQALQHFDELEAATCKVKGRSAARRGRSSGLAHRSPGRGRLRLRPPRLAFLVHRDIDAAT